MNLLPKTHEEFSQKEYWDAFFKKRGTKAFEWYGEYPELSSYLHKYIKKQDNMLVTGCGNSTLGRDLYDIGYDKITNIDISGVVIRQMLSQNEKERPNLKYLQMDALQTTFGDDEFNVVLDKGTLDALMPNKDPETVNTIIRYFKEIQRLLKIGGRFICISLLQEHILEILLEYFPLNNWTFRAVRCFDAEQTVNPMPVFMVVCTKFKSLVRQILELNLVATDKMERFDHPDSIKMHISGVQRASFVCSGLKKSSLDDGEVSLDLFVPGCDKPRFSVFVVDVPAEAKNAQYAAFVVPQGREAEWLFSTKAGRKHLVKMTKHNRLAIITMHRGQDYGTFEQVQHELTDMVCNLAPSGLTNKKIAFLSLGSDVGNRQIKYEGHSQNSGDYVIEDVQTDTGDKFRRLYYLKTQLVIQSEARLKTIKTKKGTKEIIDLNYLTCKHHIYMALGAHLATNNKTDQSVTVVGLGGGGLCSFLHKFLPSSRILGIDVDEDMLKIAADWFSFHQDDKLTAKIQDGLDYLQDTTKGKAKVNAILFDVDSKDTSIGMSCPPKQFLDQQVLDNVSKSLDKQGYFVLNMVLRDQSLRHTILGNLKKTFQTLVAYKLEDDLNEIIICTSQKLSEEKIRDLLTESGTSLNKFFKKHNLYNDCSIDLTDYLKNLHLNS